MTETFKCASCSGPLEFEGTSIQKCPFCGSTVIVPSEVFGNAAGAANEDPTGNAKKLAEIRGLLAKGQKLMAIKVFRETFGTGLKEAKDAVEALERGAGVDLTGITVTANNVQFDEKDLEAIKKVGYTVGGSILVTTGLIVLLVAGICIAVFYMVFRTVDKVVSTAANSVATDPRGAKKSALVTEILRVGGEGTGVGRFKDNRHVAVDPSGRIFSIEYLGGYMQSFDRDGKYLTQWMTKDDVATEDMAVDRKGNVLIADVKGLTVYDGATGAVTKTFAKYFINGIAVLPDGRVMTASREGLATLDAELKTATPVKDANGQANAKGGFEHIAVGGRGTIYAVDKQNGDVCKFSADGKFLNRFSSGSRSPNAIAVDPKGRVFVAQTSELNVFDENGRALNTIPVTQAFGLTFDDNGDLYIASRPYVVKYKLLF